MIQTILAFFGYVKVPKEAVLLSMEIEENYRKILKDIPDNEVCSMYHKSAQAITWFLRSGRLLT